MIDYKAMVKRSVSETNGGKSAIVPWKARIVKAAMVRTRAGSHAIFKQDLFSVSQLPLIEWE